MFLQDKKKKQPSLSFDTLVIKDISEEGEAVLCTVQEVEGICVWNLAPSLQGKKADSKVYSGVCELEGVW